MLPLYDLEKTDRIPVVTWFFVISNIAVFWFIQGAGLDELQFVSSICNWSFVPEAFLKGVPVASSEVCRNFPLYPRLSIFSSMFLHGGWGHLIFNLWFLHIFGDNVEDRWGHFRYFCVYLLAGLGGAALQFALNPESTIPNLGASGAISGVAGAYLFLFPRHRIVTLVTFGFFWKRMELSAALVLVIWGAFQVLGILSSGSGGGVAYGAHIGGFLVGVIFAKLL